MSGFKRGRFVSFFRLSICDFRYDMAMRHLAAILVLGWVCSAAAQESSPPRDPYGSPSDPGPAPPPPATNAVPSAAMPANASPAAMPPAAMPPADPTVLRGAPPPLPRTYVRQWRGARTMNGFADAIGLLSGGLSIANAIYVAAAHYPPSASDFVAQKPSPGDPAQVMSWVSSGSSAFAFGLAAGGLAWRHNILRKLGADPGRGLFIAGTVVGLVGIASIVASYVVGFSDLGNPHDQSIAVLATSLGGSAISNIGTAMYASDASKLQKAWKALTTF